MNRRSSFRLAGAGLAAAGLGAGLWWRLRHEAAPPAGAEGASKGSAAGGAVALFAMRFEKPDGGELDMARFKGQPLLLNFWGSWCPPCVAEMPELDQFASEMAPAGWQVLGLAVDNPKAVRDFLQRKPVRYAIALAGFEGATLSRDLGNSQGAMPYTVVFNRRGEVVQRKAGATHLAEMRQWAEGV